MNAIGRTRERSPGKSCISKKLAAIMRFGPQSHAQFPHIENADLPEFHKVKCGPPGEYTADHEIAGRTTTDSPRGGHRPAIDRIERHRTGREIEEKRQKSH
jgi:hypothetical protein